jgi:hypothetical protein
MQLKSFITGSALLLMITSCQQTANSNAPAAQKGTDTAVLARQLQAACVQENADFYKKDLAVWGRNFAHTPSVYWICVEDDVTLRATGWQDLEQFVGGWMKENPVPAPDSLLKKERIEDFQLELADKLAFVRFKKIRQRPGQPEQLLLENRTFQRINNEWKIIGMTSAPGYNSKGSNGNIFVHTAGGK